MKLAMFSPKSLELDRGWPGRVDGDRVVQLAAQTLQVYFTGGGAPREHAEYPLAEVDLRAPVLYPPTVRLFEGEGFVFGNAAAIFGPGQEVPYPHGARELRSGPAVVAVIGNEGAIGGFTPGNAWTAPDLPGAKSYDFALSIGPVLVTADDYDAGADWERRRESAALNTVLRPGDLLVQRLDGGRPVSRGELVEVEVAAIGVLRNRVV
jgi:2-keto-4-pentenoate hydratase/2-oxohepta-3-ene-1,7-dioic acid hydratase in catechol pathway